MLQIPSLFINEKFGMYFIHLEVKIARDPVWISYGSSDTYSIKRQPQSIQYFVFSNHSTFHSQELHVVLQTKRLGVLLS